MQSRRAPGQAASEAPTNLKTDMNCNTKHDVVIIGGGASGLAAAVELRMSSPGFSVLVIEKMKDPGRKIRATGSGRCNITNTGAAGYNRIMEFFTRIGLVTREYDNGLVYPYSESASDVTELLTDRAKRLGVKIRCEEEVSSIEIMPPNTDKAGEKTASVKREGNQNKAFSEPSFILESIYKDEKGEHSLRTEADYVILATGGKAGPTYGTTGDGYRLARELGHSIVTPVPILTGIECEEWNAHEVRDNYEYRNERTGQHMGTSALILAGTRTQAVVSLYRNDMSVLPTYRGPFFTGEYDNQKPVFKEMGEVQFTKYGLSGICIFNMTRHMKYDKAAGESLGDFFIKINLFPDGRFSDYIETIQAGEFSGISIREMLCTVLKEKLADYVTEVISDCMNTGMYEADSEGIKDKAVGDLSMNEIKLICEVVHGLEFYPEKLRGWKDAQATSGGVRLDEIDDVTSESKLVPGLYITGELADRDYPCGGYNLSNAWLTGISAADDRVSKRY